MRRRSLALEVPTANSGASSVTLFTKTEASTFVNRMPNRRFTWRVCGLTGNNGLYVAASAGVCEPNRPSLKLW